MDDWLKRYDAAIAERDGAQLALQAAHDVLERAQHRARNAERDVHIIFAERNDLREGRNGPDDKAAPGR